jgi:hypothetical protein
MKKVFTVISTTSHGFRRFEGDFNEYEVADRFIMETLSNQYNSVSKQDLADPVVRFNIEINYILPK